MAQEILMRDLSRRSFIKTGVAGATAASLGLFSSNLQASSSTIDKVKLGNTGVELSRLALGTGTHGWKFVSDQTKLGTNGFVELAEAAFDKGINFFDAADIYGSHTYVKEALKKVSRDKSIVMSKIWTAPNDWLPEVGEVPKTFDRFRKEIDTDEIDIVLLHCMTDPEWPTKLVKMRDDLSELKAKGLIKTVGCSCHSLDALKAAAESDWVEVILARVNYNGDRMDDKPEKVMPVLKKAHDNGKAILGMKIFGCGNLVEEEQRERSLNYVLKSGNVDAMTIGFDKPKYIDDAIKRVNRIVHS
jgi:1-deoxyxylulose-5-phosphate synthase